MAQFDYDEEACRTAAQCIGRAFPWSRTPEGGEFWKAIRDRLLEIASGKNLDRPVALPERPS